MKKEKYPQRDDHKRSKWPTRIGVGSALTLVGITTFLTTKQDIEQTKAPLDLKPPTVVAGAEFMDAYSNCHIDYPRLEGVSQGLARIALQVNAIRSDIAKKSGKVRYSTSPIGRDTYVPTESVDVSSVPSVGTEPIDTSFTIPMSELGMKGNKSVDIFVTATNLENENGVRQYCGTVAIAGTSEFVEYVEPTSRPQELPEMPARQRFLVER